MSSMEKYEHLLLIEDEEKRKKIISCLDLKIISNEYKEKRLFYIGSGDNAIQNQLDLPKELNEKSIFKKSQI